MWVWELRRSTHESHALPQHRFLPSAAEKVALPRKWLMTHVICALIIFMHLKNLAGVVLVPWRAIGSTVVKMCGRIKEHFFYPFRETFLLLFLFILILLLFLFSSQPFRIYWNILLALLTSPFAYFFNPSACFWVFFFSSGPSLGS